MLLLLNQILGLVSTLAVGIVTALAVPDTIWKRRAIGGLILIGFVQLLFLILTWEQQNNTAYVTQAFWAVWSLITLLASTFVLQAILILSVGLAAGWWINDFTRKRPNVFARLPGRDRRSWLSSFAICGYAGSALCNKRNAALEAYDAAERAYQDAENKKQEKLAGLGPYAALLMDENPDPEYGEISKAAVSALHEFERAEEELRRLETEIMDMIHAALESGRLVARGFLPPFSHHSAPVDIPAEQWRFLRFDKEYQTASGHNVTYIGVAVHNPKRQPARQG